MKLTIDIKDLWQDFKQSLKLSYSLWTDPKIAPPCIRTIDVAFITLFDKNQRSVGCFVPELYELAKVNGLRAQQKEKIWLQENPTADTQQKKKQSFYSELYSEDGTPKTAFELSVIPEIYSDEDKHCLPKIQKLLEREYNYSAKRNQPLPPIVFKYQIRSDYLKELHLIHHVVGDERSIKLNISNPRSRIPMIEKISHYLAQRSALILTLLGLMSLTITNPYLFASTVLLMILGKWCNEEFSTYGLTETLLRDVRSNVAKEFRWGDKISLKKTLKTLILLMALGFCSYCAFTGTFATITNYAIWHSSSGLLFMSKYLLASFASTLAALSTFMSGTVAQRFFWGLGIWDKQIDFSKEHPLKPLNHREFEDKLNHWQQKFQSALGKKILTSEQYQEYHQKASLNFKDLKAIIHHLGPDLTKEKTLRKASKSY